MGSDPNSYNRHLLGGPRSCSAISSRRHLLDGGGSATRPLADAGPRRTAGSRSEVGDYLHDAMRRELSSFSFITSETGQLLTIEECVVPPHSASRAGLGSDLRLLLPSDAKVDGRTFPAATLCHADAARVLADLGARQLTPLECVPLLESSDRDRSRAMPHPSLPDGADLRVDPVLEVLEGLLDCPGGRDDGFLGPSVPPPCSPPSSTTTAMSTASGPPR